MQRSYEKATEIVREWGSLPEEERTEGELISIIATALNEREALITRLETLCELHGVDTTEISRR